MNGEIANLRRLLLVGEGLLLLLGVTGCFSDSSAVGPPEHIGNFSIQKFHVVSVTDHGNSEWDYFEMRHGRIFPTKIGMPPNNWSEFDHITRLPSKSPAWMVEAGALSALVQEKEGKPIVQVLWQGEQSDYIQPISTARWYIPDRKRVAGFNLGERDVYSGGNIFDAATLSKYSLPNLPDGQWNKFVAVSSDYKTVALLQSHEYDIDHGNGIGLPTYSLVASDADGVTGQPLALSEDFLRKSPLPDYQIQGTSWQPWFESNFIWRLNTEHRWEVVFKSPQSIANTQAN